MMAKNLHRSVNAVAGRIQRLGLRHRYRDGWYTKTEVCEILGVDQHWVQRRIDAGVLRATYHNGERPGKGGMRMWHIAEKELRGFVIQYPQELNGRNVDIVQLVDVLVGAGKR